MSWRTPLPVSMKKTWLFPDYSQAEVRVAAWAGPIPLMKQWFKSDEDIHINVARLIGETVEKHKVHIPPLSVGLPPPWGRKHWSLLNAEDPLDHDIERDLSKRTVHANTNGMHRQRFSRITKVPLMYAGIIQDMYHGLFPEIRGSYHTWIVDSAVANHGTLENPWHWRRTFYKVNPLTGQYDEDEKRVMYAWYPQSTIGMMTIRFWRRICEVFRDDKQIKIYTPEAIRDMGIDAQLQVHDAIGASVPDEDSVVADIARAMKREGEVELIIKGDPLIVPIDFKRGYSWGDLKTYKIPG